MPNKKTLHAKIASFGSAFPDQVLSNHDIEKIVDTSDQWIKERTGISERRKLRDGENNSDMATAACRKALDAAGVLPNEVDLIIAATNTPDRWMPNLACTTQAKLGISSECGAFDIVTACAGWVVALATANAFVRSGQYRNVLVVGSEALTRFVNWSDRGTCVLFGDAAGAALVQPCSEGDRGEILSVNIHADGRHGEILEFPAGGSRTPTSVETAAAGLQFVHMKGQDVFKHAVRDMAACAQEALDAAGVTKDQVAWIIPHQANIRIVESVAKKMGFPMERVAVNLHKYGNTSAATIPTCFDEYDKAGKIKPGDLVLMTTFGGGLSWAGALIRW